MRKSKGVTMRTFGIALCAMTMFLTGCPQPDPISPQRDSARAGLLLIAKAGVIADGACSELAKAKDDSTIAKSCADVYDDVRSSLLIAESGLEAWDAGKKNDVACATKHGAAALTKLAALLQGHGAKIPSVLSDAVKFSAFVAGECKE